MKLLYEAQIEANELRKQYIEDIKCGKFTLGYALQLGFNDITLKLSNGENYEIGWLNTDISGNQVYEGSCTDLQLMTLVVLDDVFDTDDGYTCINVKCYHKEDEERFMKGGE